MGPIDNKPAAAGYFHQFDDATKTRTALRATYNPSPNNKITNSLANAGMKRTASFVNSVRNIDLSIRGSWNQRRLDNARKKLEHMEEAGKKSGPELDAQNNRITKREHNADRLADKRAIGEGATRGKMEDEVASLEAILQDNLRDDLYVPLTGLSEVEHGAVQSRYLSSLQDNHRIKIHSDGPPRLAAIIANQVSASYDRGSSGIASRSRSTLQHALVGIQAAALSVKGAAASRMANSSHLDQGGQARMQVRAARSAQQRTMLQASLQGNEALRTAYRETVNRQIDDAERRLTSDDMSQPDYVVRSVRNGVKPLQTHNWERRINQYFKQPEVEADVSDVDSDIYSVSSFGSERSERSEPQAEVTPRKKGRLAQFAERVSNARTDRHVSKTAGAQGLARVRLDNASDEEKANYQQQVKHHDTAAEKATVAYRTRRSIWQGKLIDTLQSPQFQEWEDRVFPTRDDPHDELSWERKSAKPRDED